jgi:hypothetical protein
VMINLFCGPCDDATQFRAGRHSTWFFPSKLFIHSARECTLVVRNFMVDGNGFDDTRKKKIQINNFSFMKYMKTNFNFKTHYGNKRMKNPEWGLNV